MRRLYKTFRTERIVLTVKLLIPLVLSLYVR